MARAIFHGQRGELRQRYREGQEDQLGALGLVVNAVVLWNTRYLDAVLAQVRATEETNTPILQNLSRVFNEAAVATGDEDWWLLAQTEFKLLGGLWLVGGIAPLVLIAGIAGLDIVRVLADRELRYESDARSEDAWCEFFSCFDPQVRRVAGNSPGNRTACDLGSRPFPVPPAPVDLGPHGRGAIARERVLPASSR